MPFTFEEAEAIALVNKPDGGVLVTMIEKPYGWYFYYQSEIYVITNNLDDMWMGYGGFIVDKEDGRVFHFPTAYTREENFRRYERGFKYHAYDLTIAQVINWDLAIDYLYHLNMSFVIPETAHGVTWRIPQQYSKEQIAEKLNTLPCLFAKQEFFFRVDVIEKIEASGCMVFSIAEHDPSKI